MMKRFFIRRNLKKSIAVEGLKTYPHRIRKVGIFCTESKIPDLNFESKLKHCFGNDTAFINFVLGEDRQEDGMFFINKKSFTFFGNFRDKSMPEYLSELDVVIDMSLKSCLLKDYALSLAKNSYKIALGHFSDKAYHLSINLKEHQKDWFADEIIKYHNILSHAKK